jgi:hypothetical protein
VLAVLSPVRGGSARVKRSLSWARLQNIIMAKQIV